MFVFAIVALIGCDKQSTTDGIPPSANLAQRGLAIGSEVGLPTPHSEQKRDSTFFSRMDDWYAAHLAAMKERLLFTNMGSDNSDVFRFLYLPSFHNPMVIRIEKNGDEITLVSKRLSGKGGYDPGKLTTQQTKVLDKSAWQGLQAHVQQSGLWDLPTTEATSYINDQGILTGWGHRDGAQWIVEAVRDGKYYAVERTSPNDQWYRDCAKFRRLCTYMLGLSDLKPEELY
jgi:hypothetical protein